MLGLGAGALPGACLGYLAAEALSAGWIAPYLDAPQIVLPLPIAAGGSAFLLCLVLGLLAVWTAPLRPPEDEPDPASDAEVTP